jgi:hypothetical protein
MMKRKVLWWHWFITAAFFLIICFFLKGYFLTPKYITPYAPRANGLTDEQAKQKSRDEAAELHQEAEKYKGK